MGISNKEEKWMKKGPKGIDVMGSQEGKEAEHPGHDAEHDSGIHKGHALHSSKSGKQMGG